MKALILLIAITLAGCGDSSDDNTRINSVYVLGDSLCSEDDSWPSRVRGFEVDKLCISGTSIKLVYESLYDPSSPFYDYPNTEADIFILALGANDALWRDDADYFEGYYNAILSLHPNTVCLMPPLTQSARIQPRIERLRGIIVELCSDVIYPAPSDHADGVHYTTDGYQLNAINVSGAISQYQKL